MSSDKKFILVVDDDPDVAYFLSALFEDHGMRPVQARSAEEARKRIEERRPDLVCLDVMMPGTSGLAFYSRMMRDERFREVPAIFISSVGMGRDFSGAGFRKLMGDGEAPPPFAFIEKPVDPAMLMEAVHRALKIGRGDN